MDPAEERVEQAIASIDQGRYGISEASRVFGVSRTTLHRRRKGVPSRKRTRPNGHRLTSSGEEALSQYIRELDNSGFPPTLRAVRDAANYFSMLETPVGKHWARRFVDRHPELKTRMSRAYDYKRALCEDPTKVNEWFERYLDLKSEYEISDANVYNMDEIGFQMGITNSTLVVKSFERRGRGRKIQPGGREWASFIACIGAGGDVVPPFLIVKGKYHLENWYAHGDIGDDWVISTSRNGWTDNATGVEWLKHFDEHTAGRAHGQNRMLILDGHESHLSIPFRAYCKEHNIVLVCLPAHSSHLLQPLDVGFFSALESAYSEEVRKLADVFIMDISKEQFFPAFKRACERSLSQSNIAGCFRGAGLITYNPGTVISRMDVSSNRRETPPADRPIVDWQSKTPRSRRELEAQCAFVARGLVDDEYRAGLWKIKCCAETLYQRIELMSARIEQLQKANAEKVRRQGGGRIASGPVRGRTLTAMALERRSQNRAVTREIRSCGRCAKSGHNRRTCTAPITGAEHGNDNLDSGGEAGDGDDAGNETTLIESDESLEWDELESSSDSDILDDDDDEYDDTTYRE